MLFPTPIFPTKTTLISVEQGIDCSFLSEEEKKVVIFSRPDWVLIGKVTGRGFSSSCFSRAERENLLERSPSDAMVVCGGVWWCVVVCGGACGGVFVFFVVVFFF